MQNKLPISVFIITKNEEERLPTAIKSVKDWVDDIHVIDSGSEDSTIKIAEELGAKTYFNEWNGYGKQKIFGESKCKHKWILNIDADEAISPELKNEIGDLFKNDNEPSLPAYKMRWKMVFLGQEKPNKIAANSYIVRLYNIKKAGFRDSTIHDSVILKEGVEGEIGKFKGIIYHRCFKNLTHWTDKINFYTTQQALEWLDKGRKKPSNLRVVAEPFFAFFKSYIIRKYIFLGIDGLIASVIYSFSKTLRLAKIRELYDLKSK